MHQLHTAETCLHVNTETYACTDNVPPTTPLPLMLACQHEACCSKTSVWSSMNFSAFGYGAVASPAAAGNTLPAPKPGKFTVGAIRKGIDFGCPRPSWPCVLPLNFCRSLDEQCKPLAVLWRVAIILASVVRLESFKSIVLLRHVEQ